MYVSGRQLLKKDTCSLMIFSIVVPQKTPGASDPYAGKWLCHCYCPKNLSHKNHVFSTPRICWTDVNPLDFAVSGGMETKKQIAHQYFASLV